MKIQHDEKEIREYLTQVKCTEDFDVSRLHISTNSWSVSMNDYGVTKRYKTFRYDTNTSRAMALFNAIGYIQLTDKDNK